MDDAESTRSSKSDSSGADRVAADPTGDSTPIAPPGLDKPQEVIISQGPKQNTLPVPEFDYPDSDSLVDVGYTSIVRLDMRNDPSSTIAQKKTIWN